MLYQNIAVKNLDYKNDKFEPGFIYLFFSMIGGVIGLKTLTNDINELKKHNVILLNIQKVQNLNEVELQEIVKNDVPEL